MWFRSKAKPQDILLFWGYLKHFLGAGLPLILAIPPLMKILKKKPWPKNLNRLQENLLSGKKLATSLSEEKDIFTRESIEMLKIAEEKGNYPEIIDMIIEYQKWHFQTRQTLLNSLKYPFILMGVMGGLLFLVVNQIVPQLQVYLNSMGVHELPLSTTMLIGLSRVSPYLLLFFLLIGGGVTLSFHLQNPFFLVCRYHLEKHMTLIPCLGVLYDKLTVLTFIRLFSVLLGAKVDMLISLHQSIKVLSNRWRVSQLEKGKNTLIQGEKLSVALRDFLEADPSLKVLFDLGEQTGRLPQILSEYVQFEMIQFKADVDRRVQGIQPLFILIMGGVLIWVVVSILLPLYDQMDVLGG